MDKCIFAENDLSKTCLFMVVGGIMTISDSYIQNGYTNSGATITLVHPLISTYAIAHLQTGHCKAALLLTKKPTFQPRRVVLFQWFILINNFI